MSDTGSRFLLAAIPPLFYAEFVPRSTLLLLIASLLITSGPVAAALRSPVDRWLPPGLQRLDDFNPGPEMDLLAEHEAARQALWNSNLGRLDSLATQLLESFPPESHDYMAIGSSPALFAEMLQIRAERLGSQALLTHLPLSLSKEHLTPMQVHMVRHHIHRWLPPMHLQNDRPLVLIDFVSTGMTLRTFARLLATTEGTPLFERPLRFVGLISAESRDLQVTLREDIPELSRGQLGAEDIHWLPISKGLYSLFKLRAFKQFAPYTSWAPGRQATTRYLPPVKIEDGTVEAENGGAPRVYNRAEMQRHLRAYYLISPPEAPACGALLKTSGY